jgi:squalene-hopene/tetraprenyl-beta-curcumene cyclase
MNLQVDFERLLLAHKAVRAELLTERGSADHWVGHVASSPFATAAAISALVAAHHPDTEDVLRESAAGHGQAFELVQGDLSEFLVESVHWLARNQNPDGGWGDCLAARSNIGATMLVQAAFRLTGIPAKYADLMLNADQYVEAQGGVSALRQNYGGDKTRTAPILAACALAGMVPWRQVPALPFEQVCLPERLQQHLKIPVERTAAPILLAVGRAKFGNDPPSNPLTRLLRRGLRTKCLVLLKRLQAADDGFLACTSTTAFVVMSLASIGCQDHSIVRRGIEFLLSTVRGDASWPGVTNLATTVTSLALNESSAGQFFATPRPPVGNGHTLAELKLGESLARATWDDTAMAGDTVSYVSPVRESTPLHAVLASIQADSQEQVFNDRCLDWLLDCQRQERNPVTGVSAGGWAWSDAAGALPNTSDTARVLIALARWPRTDDNLHRGRIDQAAELGVEWLLDLQTEDGGWTTFYRDAAGYQPDEPGVDVSAQAMRALAALRELWQKEPHATRTSQQIVLTARATAAIERGWQFLQARQRDDGSFIPLWFGNEHLPGERNPVCGTAEVLITCGELERLDADLAQRAAQWLLSAQHADGGWGLPRARLDYSGAEKDGFRAWRANEARAKLCSVEETAMAVTAMLPLGDHNAAYAKSVSSGLTWLLNAVEQDAHRRAAVIGFYPGGIWYHERLYPLVFAAGALSRATRVLTAQGQMVARVAR